jgi:trehalose-phosphatase
MEDASLVRRSAFERILREMQEIRYRLDEIENSISSWNPRPLKIPESELFSLPDNLRKTYMIVASKGESTATEVSNLTGRCRSIESNYLNQLVRIGWLTRRRNSKSICFRPASGETARQRNAVGAGRVNVGGHEGKRVEPRKERLPCQNGKTNGAAPRKMKIECLSSDYDGTISPLKVPRNESHVSMETRVVLQRIGRFVPISIFTMKDLGFVMARTPFAHTWSAIGGLETRIGKRNLEVEGLEARLSSVACALDYAESHFTTPGAEIEEKQDSEGRAIAFCLDWRRAKDPNTAKLQAEQVAKYCKALKLELLRYENQPFYDVYPVSPDKGRALKETLNELELKSGVLYLGDSEIDNSAFNASNVSVGVIHDETPLNRLECDYLVKFENVPSFLKTLLDNNLQFSSDFPMIEANPSRARPSGPVHHDK